MNTPIKFPIKINYPSLTPAACEKKESGSGIGSTASTELSSKFQTKASLLNPPLALHPPRIMIEFSPYLNKPGPPT